MRPQTWRVLAVAILAFAHLLLLGGCDPGGIQPGDNTGNGSNGGSDGNSDQDGGQSSHTVVVPAPDGEGEVSLPTPGIVATSGCTGSEPPPPPGVEPDCGGDRGPVRGILLEGIDGALESDDFALATLDGVSASAAGCLLSSADATSGGAVLRMILCDADGGVWDVIGLGGIDGDVVTVTHWEYPHGTALGGVGQTSGGLFYLSSSSDYTITAPGISGALTATLATSRAIGTEMVFEFDLTAPGDRRLAGTFTVVLDEWRRVYGAV